MRPRGDGDHEGLLLYCMYLVGRLAGRFDAVRCAPVGQVEGGREGGRKKRACTLGVILQSMYPGGMYVVGGRAAGSGEDFQSCQAGSGQNTRTYSRQLSKTKWMAVTD